MALIYGYTVPEHLERLKKLRQKRSSGQVAFEDIFAGGLELAAIGHELYKYNLEDNYYRKLDEKHCLKTIADYFSLYETRAGETRFASMKHINEAYAYVKARCYVSPDLVNPAGINVANGYLKITYDSSNRPMVNLLPHTPEHIFTYKSSVFYSPDADPIICNQMISDILPDIQHQEILFRTLGASLDLPATRRNRGRAIKALFLLGEGSNGKDTLRECVSQIYGGIGITSVPLQAFKTADKQQSFALYPLIHSRINWSSENEKVSIDTCQSLKSLITGDPLTVEQKYKDPFTFTPSCIPIFNINDIPALESQQEAILSRYAILPFVNTFKTDPDPNRPQDKKANPRLKDDPDYLQQNVLSAFLNLVIKGFASVLASGIDYSSVETLMKQVNESNSHILSFITEAGIVECRHSEGMYTSQLFNIYEDWCKENNLIEDSGAHKVYHDPNKYDTVVRNVRQFTRRLTKYLPSLLVKQTAQGSLLPLRLRVIEIEDLIDEYGI